MTSTTAEVGAEAGRAVGAPGGAVPAGTTKG
jgi:hypothetical protein